eukprot:gene217-biopygen102
MHAVALTKEECDSFRSNLKLDMNEYDEVKWVGVDEILSD